MDIEQGHLVDALRQQVRYTLRKLIRAPMFSAIAVLTLAVGIGSNAAIFSVVNGVLLKPLPFHEPEQLVGIWHEAPGLGFSSVNQSPALHVTYLEENRSFESIGMWDNDQASVTGLEEPEQVDAMRVTYQTLPLLGIQPAIGRTFSPEDDSPGTAQTVILGHGYWLRRFGGDRGTLGRTVTIDGVAREVIGIMPEGVRFLRWDPAIYLPFRFDPEALAGVGNFSYQSVARLRPDVTLEMANTDVDRMIPVGIEQHPGGLTLGMMQEAGFAAKLRPLKEDVVGDVGSMLWVLLGTVAIVLLIACANVANLFIVRAEGRQKEMAVRTAMGAGRSHVAGQLLLESAILGMVGGLVGLALAIGGLKLLVALGPDSLPRIHEIGMDPPVLGFTFAISVLAGGLFGLLPALKYGRGGLVNALKEGGRGGSAGKEQHFARNSLVVAQMALALVLLAGSGLMVRSFQALRNAEPGFQAPEEVLTFRVSIPSAEEEDLVVVAQMQEEMLRGIQGIPGVASAAFSSSVTMDGWDSNDAVEVEEFPVEGEGLPPIRRFKWVSDGYHATMGNPILAGRAITWADIHERALVVMVTEDFVLEYWDSPAQAVGKRIRNFGGPFGESEFREIVGVVGKVRDDGMAQDPVATIFWPQVTTNFWGEELRVQRSIALAVRARGSNPMALLHPAREAVWAQNSNLPLARVRTLEEIVTDSMARTSFALIMLGIAAGVALFLGAVGIYGVISYVVSQRTREIGVRMAMGAERADVTRMVLRQAGSLAAGGVVIGLLAAAGLTRLMSALLYGVDPMDPLTFGAVAVGLSVIALVASWIPARRAASVHPVVALRFD